VCPPRAKTENVSLYTTDGCKPVLVGTDVAKRYTPPCVTCPAGFIDVPINLTQLGVAAPGGTSLALTARCGSETTRVQLNVVILTLTARWASQAPAPPIFPVSLKQMTVALAWAPPGSSANASSYVPANVPVPWAALDCAALTATSEQLTLEKPLLQASTDAIFGDVRNLLVKANASAIAVNASAIAVDFAGLSLDGATFGKAYWLHAECAWAATASFGERVRVAPLPLPVAPLDVYINVSGVSVTTTPLGAAVVAPANVANMVLPPGSRVYLRGDSSGLFDAAFDAASANGDARAASGSHETEPAPAAAAERRGRGGGCTDKSSAAEVVMAAAPAPAASRGDRRRARRNILPAASVWWANHAITR
jgi:hypothetical protein